MLSRFAPLLLVSISAACLITGVASCNGDTVSREDAAGRPDRPASSRASSGGSSASASDSSRAVGGASSSESNRGGSGGSSNGGSSGGGQTWTGGTSSSSGKTGGGGSATSAGSSSAGRVADAAVTADAPVGGEVGPVACNDTTSNGRLGVYYYTGSQAQTQDVQIHMALINFTALTARLSQATVRYWFTDEGEGTPNQLTMYYTPTTLAKITTRFLPVSPPRVGADTVLEFTFSPNPDAGVSFVETTEFNFAFHKDGYASTYDQSNDYSFDSKLSKSFGANPKITAYLAGQLVWGCEPPVAPDAGTD
jgi:hypothetical protein